MQPKTISSSPSHFLSHCFGFANILTQKRIASSINIRKDEDIALSVYAHRMLFECFSKDKNTLLCFENKLPTVGRLSYTKVQTFVGFFLYIFHYFLLSSVFWISYSLSHLRIYCIKYRSVKFRWRKHKIILNVRVDDIVVVITLM